MWCLSNISEGSVPRDSGISERTHGLILVEKFAQACPSRSYGMESWLFRDDLPCGEVEEVPRACRIVTEVGRVRIIVQHGIFFTSLSLPVR